MSYTISWTNNGVEWTYSGVLSFKDIIESNEAIYGDPRFDDLRYQIVDLTKVDSFEVSDQNMKQIAHLDKAAARTNPRIRLAVIAVEGGGLDVAKAYKKHSENSAWESEIFDTREEAEAWLGL